MKASTWYVIVVIVERLLSGHLLHRQDCFTAEFPPEDIHNVGMIEA